MNKFDIKQDLLFARKAEGFKMYRLDSRIDDLLDALGLPSNASFSQLKTEFVNKINEIDDNETQQALLMNFAISRDYEDIKQLQQRRKLFMKNNGISLDKLLLIEDAGINELLRLIHQNKITR